MLTIKCKMPLLCPLCHGRNTVFFFADSKNYQHTYHRCSDCDIIFVPPEYRLDIKEEKKRYDLHRNDYSPPYIDFLSRLAIPMLESLSPPAVGLDFGSGISQAMANLFRQSEHTCYCYDIFYYPEKKLLSQRYDFIVASEVIEHLYEPKMVWEQWLSLLKPDGLLGVMTGLRPDDKTFANWWYKNDPTHVMLFSLKTFEYLQERYGLYCTYQYKNVLLFKKA